MAGLQALALASHGTTVALLDLRGTGDSAGEHSDATWDGWRADVQFAWEWLGKIASTRRLLWGSRLGGLLAADLVARGTISPIALLLWQPVISGTSFFNQWLRLGSAQQLTRASDRTDSKSLRGALDSGMHVEVGGYELHPDLVSGAGAVNLAALDLRSCAVIWREVSPMDPPTLSPASESVASRWIGAGTSVDIAPIEGASFWASQDIVEVQSLIVNTTQVITQLLSPETPP